ncbi:hypothetical protein PALB_28440 [Pseudoalteromonas luteoviolacea B = ATCC 29581]|nr:hypothetical protein PALB_28440 [Pseudoalteromonas luteoviolacea B = ATCC 29581]
MGRVKPSSGIYIPNNGIALIKLADLDRTRRIVIHEVVHVLNHTMIGRTPTWFDEGIAEYFEGINPEMNFSVIHPNKDWLNEKGIFIGHKKTISAIISSSNDWQRRNYSQLYSSSWSLIHYIMEDEQGRKNLALYMENESFNSCDLIESNIIHALLRSNKPDLDRAFDIFLLAKQEIHRI